MNNLDNDTLLGKAPIPRAVAAMAIPSVISSLVTVVYNMADTFFVGQTGDALQVAAVSLTNPIFILLMAFANMFGMGGSAMISVALGENNHQSVKKISSFISWASLVVGAAFAAVLLCFIPDCRCAFLYCIEPAWKILFHKDFIRQPVKTVF